MAQKYPKQLVGYDFPTEKSKISVSDVNITSLGYVIEKTPSILPFVKFIFKNNNDPTGNGFKLKMISSLGIFEYRPLKVGDYVIAKRHPELQVTEFRIGQRIGVRSTISYYDYFGLEKLGRADGDSKEVSQYNEQRVLEFGRRMVIFWDLFIKFIYLGYEELAKRWDKPHWEQLELYYPATDDAPQTFREQMLSLQEFCGCYKTVNGAEVYQGMCCKCAENPQECHKFSVKKPYLKKILGDIHTKMKKNKVTTKQSCMEIPLVDKHKVEEYRWLLGFCEHIEDIVADFKSDDYRAGKYTGGILHPAADKPAKTDFVDITLDRVGFKVDASDITDEIMYKLGNYSDSEIVVVISGDTMRKYNRMLAQLPAGMSLRFNKESLGVGHFVAADWLPEGSAFVHHTEWLNVADIRSGTGTAKYDEVFLKNVFQDLNFLVGIWPPYPCVYVVMGNGSGA